VAGNSQRKGAMRKTGSKKGATAGSGGQRRQGLEPKKPTPKATERDKHPAARRARASAKRSAAGTSRSTTTRAASSRTSRPKKDGYEYVAGRNSVVEALRAHVPAKTLYVQQYVDSDDRVREALTTAAGRGIALIETTKGDIERLTGAIVHQGLALQVPAYEYAEPSDLIAAALDADSGLLVALDGVTDPRNLGAIVRSAAGFGAQGVIVPERRAAGMTASAWKTSAGAAARVPVARATNMTRTLKAAQKAGLAVIGLAADGDVTLSGLDPDLGSAPVVLVIGSEGKGLSRLVSETCDVLVSIPMSADTESLNAGVAAGIALYALAAARAQPSSD